MRILQKIEDYVWYTENPKRWHKIIRTLIAVYRVVNKSQIKLYATSLTYGTLLAIVPLLAVLFTLLKSFGIDAVLESLLTEMMAPMGESGADVRNYLMTFVNNAQTGLLGGIGLIFLFYSIFALFRKIETALNHIWFVRSMRSLKSQLIGYLGALMFAVMVAAAAISLNVFFHEGTFVGLLGNSPLIALLLTWGAKLLSIIITAVMLGVIYIAAINSKIKFYAAFLGGLFSAMMWIPLTAGFAKMIATSSNYSLIYSSFAGLIILLVWLNILWVLFLSGGLVTYFVQYPSLLKAYSSKRLNPSEQEYFANQLMQHIISTFEKGKGVVKITHLIAKTGLNQQQILDLLTPFLLENIIINVGGNQNHFVLAMDKSKVTKNVIRKTIRGSVRGVFYDESDEDSIINENA